MTDLRLATRALAKARGFTTAAVLTLALGITLSTTAMVVLNAYLLNGLPYPAAERLYWVRYAAPGQDSPRDMERLDWESLSDTIEHPVAWDLDMFYVLGGEHAEPVPGAWVTPGFVEALGIRPAIGTGFDVTAFAPGSANVALISHRLWHSRFAADPSIVGRAFTAYVSDRPQEAETFTIAGVLPPAFWHLNSYTDILTPLRAPTFPYMVRVRPGVTPEAAAHRITALVTAGARQVPENWRAAVVSAHAQYTASIRPILRAAGASAGLVLLVACANVAGLLLVRAARRQKEIAVRTALGAGRGAIARMLLAEAVAISVAATLLALAATKLILLWLTPLLQQQLGRMAPGGAAAFAIDARVLALAAATALMTAIVCAAAPLWTSTGTPLVGALQSASRTATEGRRSQRVRSALIALEIAASLALVAGSALMARTVIVLLRADLGFNADRVLNASLTLRQSRYPDAASRLALYERMLSRLTSVPGVESVGLTTAWPMQQGQVQTVESRDAAAPSLRAAVQAVSPAYFDVLEIALVAGRTFNAADRVGSEPVAVVSETFARTMWPGGDAIGKRVWVPRSQERGDPIPVSRRVAGIVRDVRQGASDRDPADVYVPHLQEPGRFAFLLVRTAAAPAGWIAPVATAFSDIDREIAVNRPRPLAAIVQEGRAGARFMASFLALVAAIAALLALVGLYGVIAYAVRQREREIAVRMAIGADAGRITRLFVRQGAAVLLVGIAMGAWGSAAVGRLLESQLVGVTPRDPLALTAAAAAFGLAGLLAIWWPSRRAAAMDPAVALRAE